MKILINAHAITAVSIWVFLLYTGVGVLSEGGLAAAGTLFIMVIITFITIVDMFSVYFTKKQKSTAFPVISITLWGLVFIIYGMALFSSNERVQAPALYGIISTVALFKIIVSILISKNKKETQSYYLMLKKYLYPEIKDICPNCEQECSQDDVLCSSCGENLDELFEQLPAI